MGFNVRWARKRVRYIRDIGGRFADIQLMEKIGS